MLIKEEPQSQEEAELRVQELLLEARALINGAADVAESWTIKFSIGAIDFDPYRDSADLIEENEINVAEWRSSWSPGC